MRIVICERPLKIKTKTRFVVFILCTNIILKQTQGLSTDFLIDDEYASFYSGVHGAKNCNARLNHDMVAPRLYPERTNPEVYQSQQVDFPNR